MDQSIIVFVGNGFQKRRYDILKSTLCKVSDSFKLRLNGPGKEAHEGIMWFSNEPTVCWDVFNVWLQDRTCLEPPKDNPGEETMAFGSLVRLYQMAMEYRIRDFKKAILRCIVRRLVLERHRLTIMSVKENIRMIYKRIDKGDALRDVVVDWLVYCVPRSVANMQIVTRDLPADCVAGFITRLWGSTEASDGIAWASRVERGYAPL